MNDATLPQTADMPQGIPLPIGTHTLSTWEDWDGLYRLVWGESRLVANTNIVLSPCASQLPDGSIDLTGSVAKGTPEVMIDENRDGIIYDCLSVSVQGARSLAQALISVVAEIEGWDAR